MYSADQSSEMASAEAQAFTAYENKYAVMFPPPQKPDAISASGDWKFKASIVSSSASVLLAASRTMEAFQRAASRGSTELWPQVLGWIEATLAIVSVEYTIVVYSASLSDGSKHSKSTGRILQWIGIVLLGGISIIAGTDQAASLVVGIIDPELQDMMTKILVLAIGPGAALAAIISGHLLGTQLNSVNFANQGELDQYESDMATWRKGLIRSWNKSDEKAAMVGNFNFQPANNAPTGNGDQTGRLPVTRWVEQYLEENGLSVNDKNVSAVLIAKNLSKEYGTNVLSTSVRGALKTIRDAE